MRLRVTAIGRGVLLFGIDPPGKSRRRFNLALCNGLVELAVWWWEKLMPRHFREGNIGAYRYKSRTRATQYARHKRWGTWAALVNYPEGRPPTHRNTLEGYLRRMPRLRARSNKEVEASWPAPGVSKQYCEEAVTVADEEKVLLARTLKSSLIRQLEGKRVARPGVSAAPPLRRRVARRRWV